MRFVCFSSELRRAVAVILAVSLFAACTKAVDIPRDDFESAAKAESAHHRIELKDGSEYIVNEFSLTDSTMVIEKLNGGDLRYNEAKLPIVLPIGDVESVSRLETRKGPTTAILVSAAVVIVGFVIIGNLDFPATD